jgi:hypothetical protein
MKHTPGPWTVSKTNILTNEGQRPVLQDREDPAHICFVTCQTDFKRGKGWQTECAERDANARLIASAPDLLAALKALWDVAKDVPSVKNRAELVRQSRAAIAQAEGE